MHRGNDDSAISAAVEVLMKSSLCLHLPRAMDPYCWARSFSSTTNSFPCLYFTSVLSQTLPAVICLGLLGITRLFFIVSISVCLCSPSLSYDVFPLSLPCWSDRHRSPSTHDCFVTLCLLTFSQSSPSWNTVGEAASVDFPATGWQGKSHFSQWFAGNRQHQIRCVNLEGHGQMLYWNDLTEFGGLVA